MSEDTRDKLFLVAVEVIELNYKLRTDPRSRPWLWLFSSYTQWHAFSLVLVWLQTKPLRRNSRRAWEAIEKAIVLRWEHPASLLNGKKPQQWRLIIKLLEKARYARREALRKRTRSEKAKDRKQASSRGSMGPSDTTASTVPDETFSAKTHVPTDQNLNAMKEQQSRQPQTTDTPLQANATGPVKSPAVDTGTSSSMTQAKEIIQSPWHLTSQEIIPGCSADGMSGSISDLDFMMMDTELCGDDFQGVEDLSFLNDLL